VTKALRDLGTLKYCGCSTTRKQNKHIVVCLIRTTLAIKNNKQSVKIVIGEWGMVVYRSCSGKKVVCAKHSPTTTHENEKEFSLVST